MTSFGVIVAMVVEVEAIEVEGIDVVTVNINTANFIQFEHLEVSTTTTTNYE